MFEIESYKDGLSCTICEKGTNLTWNCKKGMMTNVPLCFKCVERQCKARAASKPAPTDNGQLTHS